MSRVATRRSLISRPPVATISDWWTIAGQTCVAAYQPKGAASLAASYVNLANPGTYNAAPGTAPTFDTATGWTFNGSTQYLTCGFAFASGAYSMIVRFSDLTNGTAPVAVCGAYTNTSNGNYIYPANVSNLVQARYGGSITNNLTSSPGLTSGVIAMSGSGDGAYRNGAPFGMWSAACAPSAQNVFIGCINNAGSAEQFAAIKVQALAIYSTTLSAADVAALTTRMQAL